MYSISIRSTNLDRVVETGAEFVDVEAAITKDGETIAIKRLGFPLSTSRDEVQAELSNVLSAWLRDQEIAAETERSEAEHANAAEVQKSLEGMTINESN